MQLDAATLAQLAITERLARGRNFRALAPAPMRALVRDARVVELAAGEHLWRTGDHSGGFALIDQGAIMIVTPRAGGGVAVLGVFGPDDCVGLAAVLCDGPYPADALALVDGTRVIRFAAATVRAAATTHPACAALMQAALLDHTQALRMKIEVLSAGTVAARLAAFLLHLGDRFGTARPDGGTHVPLPIPRIQLAQIVAARPETVIRTFAAWRRARIVTSDHEGFDLRMLARLHAIAHAG